MRRLLVAAAVLDLLAGTQASIFSEHSALLFAWPIDEPLTTAFIGASFWSAGILILWASRQELWIRARVTVPAIAIVVVTLLVASLSHIEPFFAAPLGIVWLEVYALIGPIVLVMLALQLAAPGFDPHTGDRIPRGLRAGLTLQGAALLGIGGALFVAPGSVAEVWPWELTALTGQTLGGWMMGVGATAAYLAWRDDEADAPAAWLSYVTLSACLLVALVRFPGGVEASDPALWIYIGFWISTLALGAAGAWRAWRAGRYAATRPAGGVPVEIVA